MIHARRRAHGRIFTVLAVAVPGALLASLLLRPEVPPIQGGDAALLRADGFALAPPTEARTLGAAPHTLVVESLGDRDGRRVLALRPEPAILAPDVLVYWTDADPGPDALPTADATLLGSLSGAARRELLLPRGVGPGQGRLLLYSLSHQEVVAQVGLGADAEADR